MEVGAGAEHVQHHAFRHDDRAAARLVLHARAGMPAPFARTGAAVYQRLSNQAKVTGEKPAELILTNRVRTVIAIA